MRRELIEDFEVPPDRVTVVPFGINDVIPVSRAPRSLARQRLGLDADERILLFFGNLAPYKGVEDLIRALAHLVTDGCALTLVLAGRAKDRSAEPYCRHLERLIEELGLMPYVRKETRYIPDEEASLLFRASDVSILPYRRVYQSGVLALSYAQGLPVIVADVASLTDDVIEGETGLAFRAGDPIDLADTIRTYFASHLFADLETRGQKIRAYGAERFSWTRNAEETHSVYKHVLETDPA